MSKITPKTLRLVYCATFIAIAVVVGSFLSFYVTESIKFNLAPVVIMLTGAILGPVWGAAAGGITDMLSFLIGTAGKPGPYFPGFTITMILYGLIAGLIFHKKNSPAYVPSIAKISLGTVLIQTICSLLINSFWNYLLYGPNYAAVLVMRLPSTYIMCAVYVVLMCILLKNKQKMFKTLYAPTA
ncbi:MAG: folate family ECF transporter S component [Christensenella sp.]